MKNKLLQKFIISCVIVMSLTTIYGYFFYEEDSIEVVDPNVFVPANDLIQEEFWTRVSEFRFESPFLRFAVEWKEGEYYLIEMDGNHRILAQSSNYSVIANRITELTLNI